MEENTNVAAPAREQTPAAPAGAPAPAAAGAVKKYPRKMPRKKVCAFCQEKVEHIDYKDAARLKKYVTEKGKILPRRMTGVCSAHQRELAEAIKKARIVALLPFKGE